MSKERSWSLGELANHLGARLQGDASRRISCLATLEQAGPQALTFLASSRYQKHLAQTRAAAVLLRPEHVSACPVDALLSDDPYMDFARLTTLFAAPLPAPEIHSTACIDPTASLGNEVAIGPYAVIGANAVIGDRCRVGAHSVIGADCRLGQECRLQDRVTLYQGVQLGQRVRIHSGTVIGADGFGFAPSKDGWVKIEQLGIVEIHDDVDIGSNCTIDRGALENTVIGRGVIIDNLVHIAHNVVIGEYTAIAGCAAVAGSTTIGARCLLAGGAGVLGHLEIADGSQITARTLVTKSIRESGSYSSGTPMLDTRAWRKSAVRFGQLEGMAERLKAVEKHLKADLDQHEGE